MIKRTNSITDIVEPQLSNSGEHIRQGDEHPNNQAPDSIHIREISVLKKKKSLQAQKELSQGTRLKLPESIRKTMKMSASGRKPEITKSKVAQTMLSRFREIRDTSTFLCGICEMEYKEDEKTRIGDCSHYYCDSCLQHYVIYKVGMFEEVICPDQQCNLVLGTESTFYSTLPADIQKKYSKLHAFYVASKDPNLKLCPQEKCEDGILKLTHDGQPVTCNKCHKIFCPKCFFQMHEGECDKNEVDFFQNNLHYRQCSSCKNVIQKSQGCNHITCRCGYQFCYICGQKWTGYDHICPQNRGGNAANRAGDNTCANCCECLAGDGCVSTILKILFIVFACIPVFLLVFMLLTAKLLIIGLLILIVTIVAGMFPYTCEIIFDENEPPMSCFLLAIYPLVMLYGIGRSFGDFFCEAFGGEVQEYRNALGQVCECLICW